MTRETAKAPAISQENKTDNENGIIVSSPQLNQIISSPFGVSGHIGENWFVWEGEWGWVILQDNSGKTLIHKRLNELLVINSIKTGPEYSLPYSADFDGILSFTSPQVKTGVIIFTPDSPMGDVSDADIQSIKIPIRFR